MKFNSTFFAAVLFGAVAGLNAAPVAENTPVYAKPDASAPVIATLRAGSEPASAPGITPSGWIAVTLAGPHEVYAANKDVTKSLDVRAGAPYLLDAKADATALATAEKGDQTEILDYRGKWTKFRLTKTVTGYIKAPAKSATATATAGIGSPAPSSGLSTAGGNAPASPPVSAPAQVSASIGKAAPVGDGGSSALPRLFQGTFAATYNPLRPRRPYDFQLTDDGGSRYAYVDVSKLLATEQLNKYVGRTVVVYGTAQAVPGSKDMVVIAESLQLR